MDNVREYRRVAVFGGVYNNALALEATLKDARERAVEAIFCLGDLGGFGPYPERVFPLLEAGRVLTIQGNYDESLALGKSDCGCGYIDPRDNYFACVSYEYTFHLRRAAHWAFPGSVGRETQPDHSSPGRRRELAIGAERAAMVDAVPGDCRRQW